MKKFILVLGLLVCGLMQPGLARASGLGKFVQGAATGDKRDCATVDPPPSGTVYRLRTATMFGSTAFPGGDESRSSLYLDGGYRFFNDTAGCSSSGGLFGGRSWWWHSLSAGVDAELIFEEPEASAFGPIIAWDMRSESKGWFSEITELFPLGLGATVGPYMREDRFGIGASAFLRALVDFRFGARYEFEDKFSWSFHIGLVDPHIFFYRLFSDSN